MPRPKLSEQELKEKQEQKEQQVNNYKEELKTIIDNLDNKTVLKLFYTLDNYNGITNEEAINLLFTKFINKDFEFKVKCIYE